MNLRIVKRKIRRRLPPYLQCSLLAEGLTVSTLIHGRVCLMGADKNPLQGTEIGILTMVGTLLNSTFNALVCMAIHII